MGPWAGAALAGGMGLLGAIAGSQRQNTEQTYTKDVAPMGDDERIAGQQSMQSMLQFRDLVNVGPGAEDAQAAQLSARNLAQLLAQYRDGGFMPTAGDMGQANSLASAMFNPQQVALQQRFQDQQVQADRMAARMGRSGNDAILRNKFMQEQTRQQQQLDSERGAYAMQQAWNLPQQRLGYAQQLTQVQSGLASQAMANRQALLSMGSQLKNQEQNFRLGTASTTANSYTGGGLYGGMTGALAGMGAGMQMGSMFASPSVAAAPVAASNGFASSSYGASRSMGSQPTNGGLD